MRRRFGLTLATLFGLAVLLSLGTWQLQRLAWKQDLLARIAAARTAPAVPIADAERLLREGRDPAWTRVSLRCRPSAGRSYARYGLSEGEIVWRAMTWCQYADGTPAPQVQLDRGVLEAGRGQTEAPPYDLPPPVDVVGVLRPSEHHAGDPVDVAFGVMSGMTVAVESETPQPAGVTPQATPAEISNNHLGYAITWYGLAAALAGVYVAMLLGDRRKGRAAIT